MPNRLSHLELTVAWVVGLWVSAISFWGFLRLAWGLRAVVLAAMPALILGGLAALTLRARSARTEPKPFSRNLLRLSVPLFVLAAFTAGVWVAPHIRERPAKGEVSQPPKDSPAVTKSRESLSKVRDEWQKLSKSESFSKLSPEEKSERKRK